MEDIVIVSAARTAVGKFGGSHWPRRRPPNWAAIVVKEVCWRVRAPSRLDARWVKSSWARCWLRVWARTLLAKRVIKAGVAKETPALTINAVCGSGLKAVMLAAQAVATGDSEIVVAGGQENMSPLALTY
jgi:acetyl-CoA C-acetyltransferase